MNGVDFGWDYPPGVHEGMIPGNRPQDIEHEERWEEAEELAHGFMQLLGAFILEHELDTTPLEILTLVWEANAKANDDK